MSEEGSAPVIEGWRADLSEDLQGNDSLRNFQDVNSLAKSFIETKAMQGSSIHLLGEDASPEQRAEQAKEIMDKIPGYMQKPDFENDDQSSSFWQTLGRPESSEGYSLPEGMEERNIEWDGVAFGANLTDAQNKKVLSELNAINATQSEKSEEAYQAEVKGLRNEWGQAYEDKFRGAAHVAKMLAEVTGVSNDAESFANGSAHPITIKLYDAIAKMVGGETVNAVVDQAGAQKFTPAEAQSKIDAINNNPKHPYWTSPSGSDEAVRMQKMMHELMEARKVA